MIVPRLALAALSTHDVVSTTCQVRINSHSDDTNNGPIAYLELNLGFSATVLKRYRTQRFGI